MPFLCIANAKALTTNWIPQGVLATHSTIKDFQPAVMLSLNLGFGLLGCMTYRKNSARMSAKEKKAKAKLFFLVFVPTLFSRYILTVWREDNSAMTNNFRLDGHYAKHVVFCWWKARYTKNSRQYCWKHVPCDMNKVCYRFSLSVTSPWVGHITEAQSMHSISFVLFTSASEIAMRIFWRNLWTPWQ